jgi:MFS family permease
MGISALATPFAGGWADKYGSRRIFVAGLIPAVAGYIGCAIATTIYEVAIWRCLTGLGYAMILISCQGYIAAIVTRENRAQGMAVFVGVLMSASMCGTAIGGILADRIGFRPVFALAAIFTLIAGFIAYRMMVADEKTVVPAAKQGGTFKKILSLRKNLRFVAVVFLAAIPAKIILTGFLYFILPLYMVTLGSTAAEIGRVMMIYPIIIIALGPAASLTADKLGNMMWMLVVGCFISGIGLVAFHEANSIWGVVLMVVIMGTAHAFTKAPQIAFVMELCEEDMERIGRTTVLGLLRTMERIGSVLGPILAATFVTLYGYEKAIAGTGAIVSASAILFLIIYLITAKKAASKAEGK